MHPRFNSFLGAGGDAVGRLRANNYRLQARSYRIVWKSGPRIVDDVYPRKKQWQTDRAQNTTSQCGTNACKAHILSLSKSPVRGPIIRQPAFKLVLLQYCGSGLLGCRRQTAYLATVHGLAQQLADFLAHWLIHRQILRPPRHGRCMSLSKGFLIFQP